MVTMTAVHKATYRYRKICDTILEFTGHLQDKLSTVSKQMCWN